MDNKKLRHLERLVHCCNHIQGNLLRQGRSAKNDLIICTLYDVVAAHPLLSEQLLHTIYSQLQASLSEQQAFDHMISLPPTALNHE